MNLSGNTILVTGGTSGIGLELARSFLAQKNTVIITGRSEARLQAAQAQLPGVHTFKSDAGNPQDVVALRGAVVQQFPALNVLVNNAGVMRKLSLHDNRELQDVTQEIQTNLCGPVWMVQQFLPHLKQQPHAAIINVSSGLAFVPMAISPVYCATKAALHSFTQSLRLQMQNSHVQVFELAPPGTETPLFHADFSEEDLGGMKGMDVKDLVKHAMKGLRDDVVEIRPGLSNVLRLMSRFAPGFILAQLNRSTVKLLLAKT